MTLASDVALDWEIFDDLEAVTVTITGSAPVTNVRALRRVLTRQDTFADSALLLVDSIVWNLEATAELVGVEIRQGVSITDAAGGIWMVESAQLLTLRTRWRCVCTKQR